MAAAAPRPPVPFRPAQLSRLAADGAEDDGDLGSAAVAAERLRPKALGHLLLLAIVGSFASFLAWAAWASIDEVTHGDGRVIPSRQLQVVQNLEGGIIAALLAREGAVVEEGQVLMRIDNVRAGTEFREKKARHTALLASAARLEAELERRGEIRFPPEVLADAPEAARNEVALFRSRKGEPRQRDRHPQAAGRAARAGAEGAEVEARPARPVEQALAGGAEAGRGRGERGRHRPRRLPAHPAAGERPQGRARPDPARDPARETAPGRGEQAGGERDHGVPLGRAGEAERGRDRAGGAEGGGDGGRGPGAPHRGALAGPRHDQAAEGRDRGRRRSSPAPTWRRSSRSRTRCWSRPRSVPRTSPSSARARPRT
jgi:pyruvate/2-oxoglutarate dehydrogenase complex dihydrolipoamide acyltransferase (E2) component